MEHLEYHPHAFLDSENFVVSVHLFESHDDQNLIATVKENIEAADVKSCCEHGEAGVGSYFYNNVFYLPKPYASWIFDTNVLNWAPPTPAPESGTWEWDEKTLSWKEKEIA